MVKFKPRKDISSKEWKKAIRELARQNSAISIEVLKKVKQRERIQIVEEEHKAQLYRKISSFASGFLVMLLAVILSFFFFSWTGPDLVTPHDEYLKQLDEVSESLQNLEDYVDNQRTTLRETQSTILELKEEEASLKTAVSLDQKQIDAVLFQYQKKASNKRWVNIFIGFILGIFSSIIAGLVLNYLNKRGAFSSEELRGK